MYNFPSGDGTLMKTAKQLQDHYNVMFTPEGGKRHDSRRSGGGHALLWKLPLPISGQKRASKKQRV